MESIPSPPGIQHIAMEHECRVAGVDSDGDGASDSCESLVAGTFAPLLKVSLQGCNVDNTVSPARLGGGYLYAVDRVDESRFVIAYLPAYHRDCGWRGLKCRLPFVDCAGHVGDSEAIFIEVEVADSFSRWTVTGIFLSAHCFGRSMVDCRWYRGRDLDRFEWVNGHDRTAPIIWVAEGRQANYPSRAACDRGHSSIDTCDHDDASYRFPIGDSANIGSASHPRGNAAGCVSARDVGSTSERVSATALECVWSRAARFRGWQDAREAPGTTPYARYLFDVGGFAANGSEVGIEGHGARAGRRGSVRGITALTHGCPRPVAAVLARSVARHRTSVSSPSWSPATPNGTGTTTRFVTSRSASPRSMRSGIRRNALGQEVRIRLQTVGPGEYVSPPFVSGAGVRFTGMADVLDSAVPAGATQEFRFRAVAYGRAVVTLVNTHSSRTAVDTIRVR